MNRLTTVLIVLVFAACSSNKFKAGDADEDPTIDALEDVDEDAEIEVPADAPEERECYEDADCDDGDFCTEDTCSEIGVCYNIDECECRSSEDCDDHDRCTIDECLADSTCRNSPNVEFSIEVIEPVDEPTISPIGDQELLQLRFTTLYSIEIHDMVYNIGADCSGDGVINSGTFGTYTDLGGQCANSGYPLVGLYNDLETNGLVRTVQVVNLGDGGTTIQGPIEHPSFDLGVTNDANISIPFSNHFVLEADSVTDVVLKADITTTSDMRANIRFDEIAWTGGPPDMCIFIDDDVLEGLVRVNE